jgi:hypothetical protein
MGKLGSNRGEAPPGASCCITDSMHAWAGGFRPSSPHRPTTFGGSVRPTTFGSVASSHAWGEGRDREINNKIKSMFRC